MNKTDSAPDLLSKAAEIMVERGKQYDKPEGERSMAATVKAFNAITGQSLTESHGWLLMVVLKMVRDNQQSTAHRDSCEDAIAYTSLYAESRLTVNKLFLKFTQEEKDKIRVAIEKGIGITLDAIGGNQYPRFNGETDQMYRQRLISYFR